VEALQVLRVARRCAVTYRTDLLRRRKALVVTTPEPLRHPLRKLPTSQLLEVCVTARRT
jgi:transposase